MSSRVYKHMRFYEISMKGPIRSKFVSRRLSSYGVDPPIIGIRREDKTPWERRVPLTPSQVGEFLGRHRARVLVQPCSRRAFTEEDYRLAGCEITEDLAPATLILGVKEVPISRLLPDRTYAFFSHTHKAQAFNMDMLDTIKRFRIRLLDYELMRNPKDGRRVVQFGYYAGVAGTIDLLHLIGKRLLVKDTLATPFLQLAQSVHYANIEAIFEDIGKIGKLIAHYGLPAEISPFLILFTGRGRVAQGALDVFKRLPHEMIEASDVSEWFTNRRSNLSSRKLYGCIIEAKDYAVPLDPSQTFEKKDFYSNPASYRSRFQELYAPYASLIIHGLYWSPAYPRLLEKDYVRALHLAKKLRLLGIADISCDLHGGMEFTERFTSIDKPFFIYEPVNMHVSDG